MDSWPAIRLMTVLIGTGVLEDPAQSFSILEKKYQFSSQKVLKVQEGTDVSI